MCTKFAQIPESAFILYTLMIFHNCCHGLEDKATIMYFEVLLPPLSSVSRRCAGLSFCFNLATGSCLINLNIYTSIIDYRNRSRSTSSIYSYFNIEA